MRVQELLSLMPSELLSDFAAETRVDHQVKKLTGEMMFKLILFSMLHSDKLSLRVMEGFLQSAKFKMFSDQEELSSKYNSIRDRICTINAEYFEKIFEAVFSIYNKELKEEKALSKCDSTYVGLASKLFTIGMKNGGGENRFVKYSVNIKGSLPSKVKVFTEGSYASEDMALSELIEDTDCMEGDIVVFDRGLQARKTFDRFTQINRLFVSRANVGVRCNVQSSQKIGDKPEDSSVTLTSDEQVFLFGKQSKKTQYEYRVIKGIIDASGEAICFVTNLLDEDAYQIAALYKQRWEIETFFKFIKQHLNVKHLVSRDKNGIKVMVLMTMILAILIIAYKKLNKIKGFKMAKMQFDIELDNEITKMIVILCGGDPNKAHHLWT